MVEIVTRAECETMLARKPYHEPENRNLNILKCRYCPRQWSFDQRSAWSESCPVVAAQLVADIPRLASTCIEAMEQLKLAKAGFYAARARELLRQFHGGEKPAARHA